MHLMQLVSFSVWLLTNAAECHYIIETKIENDGRTPVSSHQYGTYVMPSRDVIFQNQTQESYTHVKKSSQVLYHEKESHQSYQTYQINQRSFNIPNSGKLVYMNEPCLNPIRERYVMCGCERTCQNPDGLCKVCHSGCYCKEGWVRLSQPNTKGICVPKDFQCKEIQYPPGNSMNIPCENPCDTGAVVSCHDPFREEYSLCGCEKTCQNPEGKCQNCQPGCYCKFGWIRVYTGSECVAGSIGTYYCKHSLQDPQITHAPVCTRPQEEAVNCKCEKTCQNIEGKGCDSNFCSPGCVCKFGWVRHSSGECVEAGSCQTTTVTTTVSTTTVASCSDPFREEYTPCGCEKTCGNLKGICQSCRPGCYCKFGWIRIYIHVSQSECVVAAVGALYCRSLETRQVTHAPVCTKWHEEAVRCKCEKTCQDIEGKRCNPSLCLSGCVCKLGWVRNFFGECVEAGTCETITVSTTAEPPCNRIIYFTSCYCNGNCDDYFHRDTPTCKDCSTDCDCLIHFVRNSSGNCHEKQSCIPTVRAV